MRLRGRFISSAVHWPPSRWPLLRPWTSRLGRTSLGLPAFAVPSLGKASARFTRLIDWWRPHAFKTVLLLLCFLAAIVASWPILWIDNRPPTLAEQVIFVCTAAAALTFFIRLLIEALTPSEHMAQQFTAGPLAPDKFDDLDAEDAMSTNSQ